MKNKTKGLLAAYGMVLPAFLVVMLTVAYPIVSAVIQSFQDEDTGAFTTANYTYFFTETAQRNNLLYTLFVVIVTLCWRIFWHCICGLSNPGSREPSACCICFRDLYRPCVPCMR